MPAIAPMIAAAAALRVGESLLVLPDPDRTASDAIFRPGVAHFPTARIVLLEVRAREAQTLVVHTPVTGALRRITGVPPLGPTALTTLLEISPLPFAPDARALIAQLGSVPTFYLGVPGSSLADDDFVQIGADLGSVSGSTPAWIGAVFSDNLTRVPAGWMRQIAGALAVVDPANTWSSLLTLFPPNDRHVIVLDHAGRPAEPTTFQIRLSGDTLPRWTRTLPPGTFDLESVVAADPLDGAASLFAPPAGHTFEVRAALSASAIPVQALLEHESASLGDGFLAVPPSAGASTLHLQVLDLDSWYPAAATPSAIERFHPGSHLEPLVDGIPTFARLVADLARAAHTGHGAQFAGWSFNRFVLDRDDGRTLVEIAQAIVSQQGSVRLLATKFLQDEQHFDDSHDPVLRLLFILLFLGGQGVFWIDLKKRLSDRGGNVAALYAPLVAGLTAAALAGRIREILDFLEPSGELLAPMNALASGGPIAIHARNPYRFRDNPVHTGGVPLNLDSISDHVGVYHNKSQLVKFRNAQDVTEHVAYVGGIDINVDRLDTPYHNAARPYHDVHCRLTGPVVRDAWISFNERWDVDRLRAPGAPDPIPAPTLDPLSSGDRHLVRIGRTYPGLHPDHQADALPFSPQGERSIYDTLLAAIRNAKRCIFIEEQYFVGDGTVNPPNLAEHSYHAELLAAASHCDRLVILLPAAADQPWGEARRRRAISELREAWGPRLLVGFPQRRPALGRGQLVAGVGRTRLLTAIGAGDTHFRVAPAVRVPETPSWMWIDGELMLLHRATRIIVEGASASEVDVIRPFAPQDTTHWFSSPRPHLAGAPVTHSRQGSIFVHAKVMMVDDIFVSIGSANVNRRGFFVDGEINAFAIPERLMAASDNPARALRVATWAQHLGLPPSMGAALLGDPIGATDLLHRSPWLGNRFTPLDAVDLQPMLASLFGTELMERIDAVTFFLKFALLSTVEANRSLIWNLASDPTSFVDPHRIRETF